MRTRSRARLRIIVTGLIAQYPLGGMTWHYLQYLLGLKAMGHEVFYLEDTGSWPYDAALGGLAYEHDRNVGYLSEVMRSIGLQENWAYRVTGENQRWWFGLGAARVAEIVASADLLLNVSGSLRAPEEYRHAGRLAYIDTDPVFPQIKLANGDPATVQRIEAHDILFSFGERIGQVMPGAYSWLPTRPPVVLSEWANEIRPTHRYTTIMNWTSYASESFRGRVYGQKDVEFPAFLDLPDRLPSVNFEIAGGPGYGSRTPTDLLTRRGWSIVDPRDACPDLTTYRSYIQRSRGEWSVAKNAYVQSRCGWFSERSACYLASGRPVVVQDTGFSDYLPVGRGLLSFRDLDEAVGAIEAVEADYRGHSAAAQDVAREHFDSARVLSALLDDAS